MKARARVVAERDGRGGTRLAVLRSEAPLILRNTPDGLYLVGGAGGPLGGDDLTLEIEVGTGATLTVRTAAASVALPGDGPSAVSVHATVASGGALRWLPEPAVVARGCLHHMQVSLELEGSAAVMWREELVLGRYGEACGSVVSRTKADVDGAPLLRHELALGPAYPASTGPAMVAGDRAVGSVLLVGFGAPAEARVLGPGGAVLPLAAGGAQVLAVANSAPALRRLLDDGSRVPCAPALSRTSLTYPPDSGPAL